MNLKPYILYGILAVFSISVILLIPEQNKYASDNDQDNTNNYQVLHGKIKKTEPGNQDDLSQILKVVANSGAEKGKLITVSVSSNNNFNTYKTGEEVQIYKMTENNTGNVSYEAADYYHQDGLIYIFIIFAIISVIIAQKKGITAIASVIISLLLFYFLFLRMVVAGYSPLLACFSFVFLVTILTIPLIHGFNKKSLSSIIAILIGYIFSILLTIIFKNLAQLGNNPDETFRTLKIMYPTIDLVDILIASLFMGAIGALIDTAVSISSAIFEALKEHSQQTFKQVYKIGVEIGKDILGSMINTLLFAYLASSLPFLILVSLSKEASLSDLINLDFIALELTRTLIGALSLVILIPIISSISAYYFTKTKRLSED